MEFLKDRVLRRAQSGRRQSVVVELRHTPGGLTHGRCAAWAFVGCVMATGHDRPHLPLFTCIPRILGHMPPLQKGAYALNWGFRSNSPNEGVTHADDRPDFA